MKNMKPIFKRVISSRLVQGCYTSVRFPHHGGGHSSALHSPGLSRSPPAPPLPSLSGMADIGANLSTDASVRQDLTDLSEVVKELRKEMGVDWQERQEMRKEMGVDRQEQQEMRKEMGVDRQERQEMRKEMGVDRQERQEMRKEMGVHRQSLGALSVPYVNIVAGEVLLWVSGVQPKSASSKAYEVLVNSTSVAKVLQVKKEDYKNFLLTILGDRNNSAHLKTLDSLEKAVADAKAMVEHFPSHIGEEQIRVLENFDKLRGLIEGGKV